MSKFEFDLLGHKGQSIWIVKLKALSSAAAEEASIG